MSAKLALPAGIDDESTRALLALLDRWDNIGVERVLVWHVDSVIEGALPFLADTIGVTGPEFGGAGTPRTLLRRGIDMRRRRGVASVLRDVIRALDFGEVELTEHPVTYYDGSIEYDGNWVFGGDSHWAVFVVVNDIDETMTLERARILWDAIDKWKPQRCQFALALRIGGTMLKTYRTRDAITALPVVPELPEVDSIAPDTGDTAGGTNVTITGSHFTGATSATVGGVALTSFLVVDDSTITGVTGAHAASAVDVAVTGPAGEGSLAGGFTYAGAGPAPAISSLGYALGDTLGGGSLIPIHGTGFVSGCGVTFGGTASPSVTFVSATEIHAELPAHAAGVVDVVITNPDAQDSGASGASAFEFWDPGLLSANVGFWEDYHGGSWPARSGSVADTLIVATDEGLTVGAGAGGFGSVEFAGGLNHGRLVSTSIIDEYVVINGSADPGSFSWVLTKPTGSSGPFEPGSPYNHGAPLSTNAGGYWLMAHCDDGFVGNVYDGTYDPVLAPCSLGTGDDGIGAWHLFAFLSTPTVAQVSVDGSPLASHGTSQGLSAAIGDPYVLQVGCNYSATFQYQGEILAFGITRDIGTDADVTKLRAWASQRFGVSV